MGILFLNCINFICLIYFKNVGLILVLEREGEFNVGDLFFFIISFFKYVCIWFFMYRYIVENCLFFSILEKK